MFASCLVHYGSFDTSGLAAWEGSTRSQGEGVYLKAKRPMNWDRLEGEWKQRRGKAVHHLGKTMDHDLAAIAGTYEEFVGKLQERHGTVKEEADQQVKAFNEIIGQLKESNAQVMQLQKSLHDTEGVVERRVIATIDHPSRYSPVSDKVLHKLNLTVPGPSCARTHGS